MRSIVRFSLYLICIVSLALISVAREVADRPTFQQSSKKDERIDIRYTPNIDQTSVFLKTLIELDLGYRGDIGKLGMTSGFTYSGRTLSAAPQSIVLRFFSASRMGWQFDKEPERTLSFNVDGERISLENLERQRAGKILLDSRFYDKSSPNYREEFLYRETVETSIPHASFIKIANGQKVILELGKRKLKLNQKHLAALSDLTKMMTP